MTRFLQLGSFGFDLFLVVDLARQDIVSWVIVKLEIPVGNDEQFGIEVLNFPESYA